MHRHLISDAHECINEIPTVPIYYLAKPQPRERAWQNQRGKKTLLGLIPGRFRRSGFAESGVCRISLPPAVANFGERRFRMKLG